MWLFTMMYEKNSLFRVHHRIHPYTGIWLHTQFFAIEEQYFMIFTGNQQRKWGTVSACGSKWRLICLSDERPSKKEGFQEQCAEYDNGKPGGKFRNHVPGRVCIMDVSSGTGRLETRIGRSSTNGCRYH